MNRGVDEPDFDAGDRLGYSTFFRKFLEDRGWKLLQVKERATLPDALEGEALFVFRDLGSGKEACVESSEEYKRIDLDNGYTFGNLEEHPYREIEFTEELFYLFGRYVSGGFHEKRTIFGESLMQCIGPGGYPLGVYLLRARVKFWDWEKYVADWPDSPMRYR